MDSISSSTFSIWNIESIFQFAKDNILQLLLIILVFAIIYAVDHITNINAILYAMPSLNAIAPQKPAKTTGERKRSKH
jgi:hypothetical protein